MSSVESRFDEYLSKYAQFAENRQQMTEYSSHEALVNDQLEKKTAERQQKLRELGVLEQRAERQRRELSGYKTIYAQSSGIAAGANAEAAPSVDFVPNDLTDPVRFQEKQDEIARDYQKRLDNYYNRNRLDLENKKRLVNDQLGQLHEDKDAYAVAKIESISSGCTSVIEAKKKEVKQYLTCSSKIKSAAQPILHELEFDGVDPETCGTSEEDVIKRVISLEGTDRYPRKQTVDLNDLYRNRERYQSKTLIPFLVIIGIGLMVLFTMGFTPMKFIVPSSTSVAGVSRSIAEFALRLFGALFVSAIIGVFVYFLFKGISEKLGIIAIIAITIGMLVMVFSPDFGDSISLSSLMGFGKAVHGVVLFVLNLILCAAILALIYLLATRTPLAKLFFKTNHDVVQAGFQDFLAYYEQNRSTYHMLFNITDAVSCAAENRLSYVLASYDRRIADIRNDAEYKRLESNRDERLKERRALRDKQLEGLSGKSKELAASIAQLETEHTELQETVNKLNEQLGELRTELNKTRDKEEKLRPVLSGMEAELKEETEKLIAKDGQNLNKEYCVPNTARQLLDCEGKLAENLYLVRNKLDESGLAVVRKLPLRCEHTVFTYDRSEIRGNNLSEELGLFIIWFTMSMLNVNPRELLLQSGNLNMGQKVQVVDLVSGQSVLTMAPYNHVFQVVSDQKEKSALAEKLEAVIKGITMDLNRSDLRGDGVHMTDLESLNQRKMQINKPDIERVPDLPASRLVEPIRRYSLIFFIVPPATSSGMQLSVLSEELKRIMVNSARYGIIPVFLVDSETLTDVKNSEDAAYLGDVQNKSVWHIQNVGKDRGELLDIE